MRRIIGLLCTCFCLFADSTTSILPAGEVFHGDYMAKGRSIEISGTVNGDVYAFGGQVIIDGTVNGNVLLLGGTLQMEGFVSQNIRALAGQVIVSGHVGGNITACSGSVEVLASADVGNSVIALAGNVDLAGPVHGEVFVGTSNLRIAGFVGGDVTAYVNRLRVTSKAHIDGSLEYRSHTPATIDTLALIKGEVNYHPSLLYNVAQNGWIRSLRIGAKLLPLFMNFFYTLVLGLIIIRYFPHSIERAVKALMISPWSALLAGVVILVILPIVSLLFLMTILGAPFAITLIAVNVFAFYTAKIFVIMWLEKRFFVKRFQRRRRLYFFWGLIAYFMVTMIPYIGHVISISAMILGLGAMVRGRIISSSE